MIRKRINGRDFLKVEGSTAWKLIKEKKCDWSDTDCQNGEVFIPLSVYVFNRPKYGLKPCEEPMKGLQSQFTM